MRKDVGLSQFGVSKLGKQAVILTFLFGLSATLLPQFADADEQDPLNFIVDVYKRQG